MDLRAESLVQFIHTYRDKCKVDLNKLKENFEKYNFKFKMVRFSLKF